MRRLIVSAFLCLAFAIGFTVCAWANVDDRVYPTAISIPESIEIDRNDVRTIRPELTPVNAETSFSWTSLDYSIAEIHSAGIGYSGNLIGINAGETVITVTTDNGLSASCTVTVKYRPDPVSIEIPETYMLKKGDQWDIPIILTPTDASARFSIESSNPTVVEAVTTASNKGVRVYGKAPGEATVLVKTLSGLEATSLIIVEDAPDPESISIPESYEMHEGESWDIPITLLPTGVKTSFSISTTDSRVTRVATTGGHIGCRVIGGVRGTAVVTVCTENGLEAKCFVTVLSNQNDEDLPEKEDPITKYQISIIPSANGTVVASEKEAVEGDIISLTSFPNTGYELSSINVIDASGNATDLSALQFVMPAGDVTVSASFSQRNTISGVCGRSGNNLAWSLDSDGTLTISGNGNMADYSNSSAPWFSYHSEIKKVIFEGNVTSIGNYAFNENENLASITVPSSIVNIGINAFYGCRRFSTAGPIGSGCDFEFGWITEIPANTFYGCFGLTSITIPDGIEKIGRASLGGCMSDIYIPASVSVIDEGAFYCCDHLRDIFVSPANDYYCDIDGVLYSKDMDNLICYPQERMGEFLFPDSVEMLSNYAFGGSNITSISIPSRVSSIPDCAFNSCTRLKTIVIPNSIKSIGSYAFNDCRVLSEITFDGTEELWSTVNISQRGNDKLFSTSIIFTKTAIASGTCGQALNWVLDDSGDMIISGTGAMNDYTEVLASWYDLREIITTVNITNGVTSIGDYSFSCCSNLINVKLPDGLDRIGEGAFYECKNVTNVTIPRSVSSIGFEAFYGCNSLTSLTVLSGENSIGANAFFGCNALKNAGPIGSGCDYQFSWTTAIPSYAFFGCSGLTKVTIPESVESIGNDAFFGCSGLLNITIPENVKTIGDMAFAGCFNLNELIIPGRVISIGANSFGGCSGLRSVTIPESVSIIGEWAFEGCNNLKSAGPIGSDSDFQFGWKEAIPSRAFSGCDGLMCVIIPAGITSIGESAFNECRNLADITLPVSMTTIGYSAFNSCSHLTDVFYNGILQNWNSISMGIGNDALKNATLHHHYEISVQVSTGDTTSNPGIVTAMIDGEPITTAMEGSGILLSVVPADGYKFDSLSVMQGSTSLSINDNSFIMPSGDVLVVVSFARVFPVSGIWGENVTWTLDENGLLTIIPDTRSGIIKGFGADSTDAWLEYRDYITSVFVADSGKSIGENAFRNCNKLVSVRLPYFLKSMKSIGSHAFDGCSSLTNITIPYHLTYLGAGAFSGCSSLTNIKLPSTMTSIGQGVFRDCINLESITIPDSIYHIESSAFRGCKALSTIIIPEGVKYIDTYLFDGCVSLESITLPESVERVEYCAFSGCNALTDVHFGGTSEKWNTIIIGTSNNALSDATIHFAKIKIAFDRNGGEGETPAITTENEKPVSLPSEIPERPDFFFLGWAENADATIAEYFPGGSFTTDADTTLYAIWGQPDFILPRALTSIDEDAFSGGAFTFVQLPDNAISICSGAFSNCRNLRYIIIPENVDDIADTAFENGVNIIGVPGSTAYEYASAKNIQFIPIG